MASRYAVGDEVRVTDRDTLRKSRHTVPEMLSMANKVATIDEVYNMGSEVFYSLFGNPWTWYDDILLPIDQGIKDMDSLLNFIGE